MELYRSGHNEAVLKTVCLHGHMGSNPILSAEYVSIQLNIVSVSVVLGNMEKYPSG